MTSQLLWQGQAKYGTGWGFLYHADCLELLTTLDRRYRLVFGDPPFGKGQSYLGSFKDVRDPKFWEFMEAWILMSSQLLIDGGRLCIHCPPDMSFKLNTFAESCGLKFDEKIIWHYRFGQHKTQKYIDSYCELLVYTNNPNTKVWNPDGVLVQTDRAKKYNDKRTQKKKENPGMRVPFNVWGADITTFDDDELEGDGKFWGRVTGKESNKERSPSSPNQLPEKYLERVINGYTNPEDWICDPFCGTATTAVVASALGRHCVTCDQSVTYVQKAIERFGRGAVRV